MMLPGCATALYPGFQSPGLAIPGFRSPGLAFPGFRSPELALGLGHPDSYLHSFRLCAIVICIVQSIMNYSRHDLRITEVSPQHESITDKQSIKFA